MRLLQKANISIDVFGIHEGEEREDKTEKNPDEIATQQFSNLANAIKTHRSQKLNGAQAQEKKKKKYTNTFDYD